MSIHDSKVVIIGSGFVGASIAYAAMIRGLCTELVLVDINRKKAEGEVMDLSHGLPFVQPLEIRAGGYEECAGAEIIVITAGANQEPGQSRLDLAQKNAGILRSILKEIEKYERDAILLIVTNPVDVLTTLAVRHGFPGERVIGSGTVLDTARFRYLLSRRCGISAASVHAYVVGEHGDSEVPLFSSASIAGSPLSLMCGRDMSADSGSWREEVTAQVRRAAYEIINRKGATYYGIGLSSAHILQSVLRDEHSVLTVSGWLNDSFGELGTALSVPSVLGKGGIERRLQVSMSPVEEEMFRKSAQALREVVGKIQVE
ncbi:L-lactate dehydrogenase [Peptococcaceae bacterium CEB3]|nr:L-lactate dehydrogenase [Peptococcaceae bacterium CEB3]